MADRSSSTPTQKRPRRKSRQWSQKDAAAYPEFGAALGKIGKVIGEALALTPPNIDNPCSGDLWGMLKTGRSIRKLGKKDLYRVLRWGPMAVADLVAEFFDTEPLRATIAARGIFGTFLGPWSAGSALVLMLRAAADASQSVSRRQRSVPCRWRRRDHASHGRRGETGGRGNSHQR